MRDFIKRTRTMAIFTVLGRSRVRFHRHGHTNARLHKRADYNTNIVPLDALDRTPKESGNQFHLHLSPKLRLHLEA